MDQEEPQEPNGSSAIDWICTALGVAAFFVYILVIAFAPETFVRPVAEGTFVSVGIAAGAALTVFLVALAGTYTWLRNREPR